MKRGIVYNMPRFFLPSHFRSLLCKVSLNLNLAIAMCDSWINIKTMLLRKNNYFLIFIISAFILSNGCYQIKERNASGHSLPVKQDIHGYYLIPCRIQGWDLQQWKESFDCFAADSINTIIFWIPGAFRSEKFPETWNYNTAHKNVENDFYKELIDYSHTLGIKVILGFSPFAYDGVNQYPFKHPENRELMKKAQHVLYYDPSPIWGNPKQIKESSVLCKNIKRMSPIFIKFSRRPRKGSYEVLYKYPCEEQIHSDRIFITGKKSKC